MSLKKYICAFLILNSVSFAQANEPDPIPPSLKQRTSQLQDKDIDTQIHMLFKKNPILKAYSLSSTTHNKLVTLKGAVSNQVEKELAFDIASLVEYVKTINNKIKINTKLKTLGNVAPISQRSQDAAITSLIKTKFLLDPVIHGLKIHVKTLNKITILNGTVSTKQEKQLAYETALKTRGVLSVKNKIKVFP